MPSVIPNISIRGTGFQLKALCPLAAGPDKPTSAGLKDTCDTSFVREIPKKRLANRD